MGATIHNQTCPYVYWFRWRPFWAHVVNCDFIKNKYSIFTKFGMCPVKVLRQLHVKYYIVKEFIVKRHLSVKLKKKNPDYVRTNFSCIFMRRIYSWSLPQHFRSSYQYKHRITQLLSVICLCISYTTTCFGQTVWQSSGILQSHINSDLGWGLSSYKQ